MGGAARDKGNDGNVLDQASFCWQVAVTNKLELLKWAREVKQCEWDEKTITVAVLIGNLEMLKYCFSNGCPCDEEESCELAAIGGHLDCLRFLFDKVKPSRDTEEEAAMQAAGKGHIDILKYFVEERKISDDLKLNCVATAARNGRLDCLKYLVEEAKAPLNDWEDIAWARYKEHPECVNYLQEKGFPEPTDGEYANFVEIMKAEAEEEHRDVGHLLAANLARRRDGRSSSAFRRRPRARPARPRSSTCDTRRSRTPSASTRPTRRS